MANGNSELRAELYRLTLPPEGADLGWLDVQVREMEALNERIPHSVRLHRRFSPPIYEVNCFMFALGIEADAVSDMRLGPVFPGKQFVESLLANGDLREVEGGVPSSSIFATARRRCRPMGWCRRDLEMGAAGTHIWRHALWDVPASYGDEARFFAALPTRRRALPALGRGPRPLSDWRGVHIQYYSAQIDA